MHCLDVAFANLEDRSSGAVPLIVDVLIEIIRLENFAGFISLQFILVSVFVSIFYFLRSFCTENQTIKHRNPWEVFITNLIGIYK